MSDKNMLQLAADMLEETNLYNKPLEDFHYSYVQLHEINQVSLLGKLKIELQGKKRSTRRNGALQKDYEICYEAIRNAMVCYIEDYRPQSYAFLQDTKLKFCKWLNSIAGRYGIAGTDTPEELQIDPQERDTAITMLKTLHSRKRVTVEEISQHMCISNRAVQKNLKKLDPSWNSGQDTGKEKPFRIGGQPVNVTLDIKQPDQGKKTLYRTTNTVHPLVLLENQMQIGTLLKSLAHSYYTEESGVCYSIGLDIWCQLSEYSKERVKIYFASDDEQLQDFIWNLENAVPNDDTGSFQTERKMVRQLGAGSLSKEEGLAYVTKGFGRRCDIVIRGREHELIGYTIDYRRNSDGNMVYIATGPDGDQVEFLGEDLENINIEI